MDGTGHSVNLASQAQGDGCMERDPGNREKSSEAAARQQAREASVESETYSTPAGEGS